MTRVKSNSRWSLSLPNKAAAKMSSILIKKEGFGELTPREVRNSHFLVAETISKKKVLGVIGLEGCQECGSVILGYHVVRRMDRLNGVGKMLLEAAIAKAKEARAPAIYVVTGNNASRYYQKHGFAPVSAEEILPAELLEKCRKLKAIGEISALKYKR